jgi:two-component system, cell cycle sensor histidine kinase and response regulator CckA
VDWNHQAEVTFGLSCAEAVGRPLADIIAPPGYREAYARATHYFLDAQAGPLLPNRLECMALHRDGKARPIELTIWPVRVGEGYNFNAFARDLSERKQVEPELLQSAQELRQAQKREVIGRLVGGVAHDFNNLLTAINGFSALVLDRMDPADPRRGHVLEIAKAGASAATLTQQLLEVSGRPTETEVLDLNTVVADIERIIRRLVGEDVEVVTALSSTPMLVRANRGELEQVILNLAVNARDAMPQGGRFTVGTTSVELGDGHGPQGAARPGPYVLLTISDTGHGMDPTTQNRAFEPFFTTKEQGKGTGLGLAIVSGIVDQSGGHIRTESRPGHGTTFKIYLPQAARAAIPAGSAPPAAGSLRGSETILVVEDDEGVRSVLRSVL